MSHENLINALQEIENFVEAAISAVEHGNRDAAINAAVSIETRALVLRGWIEKEVR